MDGKTFTEFAVQPGETWLTSSEYAERYKVSKSTQCRHRRDGDGPPFVIIKGRVLYPESGIVSHFSQRLVRSTAELPMSRHGDRYRHLPAARDKAAKARQFRQS
jgi:hypothetical protein